MTWNTWTHSISILSAAMTAEQHQHESCPCPRGRCPSCRAAGLAVEAAIEAKRAAEAAHIRSL